MDIRARRGNTLLELIGQRLVASIDSETVANLKVSDEDRNRITHRFTSSSVPVSLGNGDMGVGGTSSAVEFEFGMTTLSLSWWMSPPQEWEEFASAFRLLAELLPTEVRTRYDFARGGE